MSVTQPAHGKKLAIDQIEKILGASHPDPFSFLGLHRADEGGEAGWIVRSFRPHAQRMWVEVKGGERVEADRVHPDGFFEARLPFSRDRPGYRLEWEFSPSHRDGISADPYSFGPLLGEQDVYFLAEGTHRRLYEVLGAHPREFGGVKGVMFSIWAPNARRVSVVGDFNDWDGRIHPMRKRVEAGVWELFLPDVGLKAHYKFEVFGADGCLAVKSDPLAFYSQCRSETASLVWDWHGYEWGDGDWMAARAKADPYREAISIYEVHIESWARIPEEGDRPLSYRELADRLVAHVKELGFTHIELLPVTEYPFDGSWGYQVTGYFAPTSRFGPPDDFRYFVDRCHQNGIGVILDWVPAHFPKDAHGLARFDGTPLYEHMDPREGEHRDWGTLIFNFGRNEVRNFLVASALFWLREYHIDGLRVDAVASMLYRDYSRKSGEWIPNRFGGRENLEAIDFLRELNSICYGEVPGIAMYAEESTAFGGVSRPVDAGGLGFGFKWNMGWMNDSLEYMSKNPIHRRHHHDNATFSMLYAYDENFVLVLSHDEVVHGKKSLLDKMPGDNWQKFANLRMFLAWMYAHPGKKLLFQGTELAPFVEWKADESLPWHLARYPEHRGVWRLLSDLNRLYRDQGALHDFDHASDGFEWIDANDSSNSVFSFLRKGADGVLILVAVNATPVPRERHRLGVPEGGYWQEVLNTDADLYAGSNMGNQGGVQAAAVEFHGRPWSVQVCLPPLATVMFRFTGS
jgi:1,4-alpha-glucan branching enzyme